MAKTWVLDTETKGTGAHIAPLAPAGRGAANAGELTLVTLQRPARAPAAQPPPRAPRLKVVDLLGARTLGEDIDVREAVRLLEGARSVLDVQVFARARPGDRWRLLALDQLKTLWSFRGRAPGLRSTAQ